LIILDLSDPVFLSLCFLGIFLALVLSISASIRARRDEKQAVKFRTIPAFSKMTRAMTQSVEEGKRLHLSLGRGGLNQAPGTAAIVGLNILKKSAEIAALSDRPPVATSGMGELGILSQDVLLHTFGQYHAENLYDPTSGQVSGLTPWSYAAGVVPVVRDQHVSLNYLSGHYGSEAALIADAGERSGGQVVAGSNSLSAQAIFYAMVDDPLVGEELYAAGAYIKPDAVQIASLLAQDIVRWIIVAFILVVVILKLAGIL
jgi:hypothetical protein